MRPGRSILALLLGLALFGGAPGCKKHSDSSAATVSSTPTADGNGQIVSSDGFSVQVPAEWVKRSSDQPHVVMMVIQPTAPAGNLPDMLIVTAVPLRHPERPPTMDAELAADKRVLSKNHPEAEYGPVETAAVDGTDARLFWVKYQIKEKAARSHRMIAIHNNKCFMVLFTTDQSRGEESDQQFKSIVSMWKWK